MFLLIVVSITLLVAESRSYNASRRIINGGAPHENKPWVVYIVQSKRAKTNYDAWVCGGTLVTTQHIITSAACVEDVQSMFAIAGYKNYVNGHQIDEDRCTKTIKNKIIKTCVPKYYKLVHDDFKTWVTLDIAVAWVKKPYNFGDPSFTKLCSYAPAVIGINYDRANEFGGAMIYGWGHVQVYRQNDDTRDLNQKTMNYAPVAIVDKSQCLEAYSGATGIDSIIKDFAICSYGRGGVSDTGNRLVEPCRRDNKDCIHTPLTPKTFKRLSPKQVHKSNSFIPRNRLQSQKRLNSGKKTSNLNKLRYRERSQLKIKKKRQTRNPLSRTNRKTYTTYKIKYKTRSLNLRYKVMRNQRKTTKRRYNKNLKKTATTRNRWFNFKRRQFNPIEIEIQSNNTELSNKSIIRRDLNINSEHVKNHRRASAVSNDYGPCQNDHGGPISSFIGRYEVLLGVQSAFILDQQYACHGPFLYTSTASCKEFLDCVIFMGTTLANKGRIDCKNPIKLGFDYDWHFDTT